MCDLAGLNWKDRFIIIDNSYFPFENFDSKLRTQIDVAQLRQASYNATLHPMALNEFAVTPQLSHKHHMGNR